MAIWYSICIPNHTQLPICTCGKAPCTACASRMHDAFRRSRDPLPLFHQQWLRTSHSYMYISQRLRSQLNLEIWKRSLQLSIYKLCDPIIDNAPLDNIYGVRNQATTSSHSTMSSAVCLLDCTTMFKNKQENSLRNSLYGRHNFRVATSAIYRPPHRRESRTNFPRLKNYQNLCSHLLIKQPQSGSRL